ncbi:hypothetical protein Dshi_2819 [Dinoroseobacter shibae DFL 12 = DSM 16493]|jgi:hypothetical protein|uniref:DUF3572 domain-containing protein n=1 Tax=Dinoroseobacter shibae (strain DSM 16493 / NCIMB 14021 / DFL 12) TaxID=398580 RepID=A8LJ57_DINSH|nr:MULTISPECIES: DUF3572 domain-containing protein [Dinoroseobacter]ABV94552.1 hypothetical protein Dshi_2819 [Dinoroseobacter shibae DFL 12 = DSM 16493]MDD9717006.1 DUF3572 domain-containing protein [Dinoroseobacter sp. PD6]URF45979.1 DUF3572 domain-containing protein [Dinoroseobacter shibae]URF50285.1 DUF3572 domain-containing protein [Dinoroseobacter shibae]
MQQEAAEALALEALGWIASQEDLMGVFLGATGSDVATVRAQAQDPQFLVSVLDFLLMDDAWVIGFCDAQGRAYDAPMRALAALPGGAQMHWT